MSSESEIVNFHSGPRIFSTIYLFCFAIGFGHAVFHLFIKILNFDWSRARTVDDGNSIFAFILFLIVFLFLVFQVCWSLSGSSRVFLKDKFLVIQRRILGFPCWTIPIPADSIERIVLAEWNNFNRGHLHIRFFGRNDESKIIWVYSHQDMYRVSVLPNRATAFSKAVEIQKLGKKLGQNWPLADRSKAHG